MATLANIPLDNLRELTWFNEKIESIKNDILPISRECGVSIAKSIKYYYLLNDLDEDVIDKLYDYRESHGLRFAFRGRDIPDIYIGKIDDGYQISCSDTSLEFCYDFDINKFMSQIDHLRSRSYRSPEESPQME